MKTLRDEINTLYTSNIETFTVHTAIDAIQIAKQMDALLEECAKAFEWYREDSPKDIALHEKLKQAGYGNDADR